MDVFGFSGDGGARDGAVSHISAGGWRLHLVHVNNNVDGGGELLQLSAAAGGQPDAGPGYGYCAAQL